MIKFLHAADLHLDSAFAGLSAERAAERRREQRQMLQSIVALCNENVCDLLLLSGDLFDSENAYPETIEALVAALSACRARVFIAPGNHDFLRVGSPYLTAQWSENVHVFAGAAITSVALPDLGCTVYGAGFTQMDCPSLLRGFTVADDQAINLMVLHGVIGDPTSPYNPITEAEIAATKLTYLALGHVHATSSGRAGKTVYAYPGCPMGRGFDELGKKGVLLGTVDENGCAVRFVPLDERRYEILTVTAGEKPLAAIEAALPADTEKDIYRIILTGEADPIDTRALSDALSPRFYSLEIRDCTLPRVNLWDGAGEMTLRGCFLAKMKEKYDAADEQAKPQIAAAARCGLDAIDGREEALV